MIRRISFVVSIPFLFCATYLTWCLHRISVSVFRDKLYPRAWPYPDSLSEALASYYDKMYPAPAGFIKIHGEYARVQATFAGAALLIIAIGIALFAPEFRRALTSVIRNRKEFYARWAPILRLNSFRIRFRLRSLFIALAIGPPLIAWVFYHGFRFNWIEFFLYFANYRTVSTLLALWIAAFCSTVIVNVVGEPN